jgi:hypothetical protein
MMLNRLDKVEAETLVAGVTSGKSLVRADQNLIEEPTRPSIKSGPGVPAASIIRPSRPVYYTAAFRCSSKS